MAMLITPVSTNPDQIIGNNISQSPITTGRKVVVDEREAPLVERPLAERLGDLVTKAVPLTMAAGADTILQTFGVTDDDTLQRNLDQYLPTYGTYYERNKEALKLAGDITGMFVPGTLAIKGLQGGSYLFRSLGMADNIVGRALLHSGKTQSEVLRGVRYYDRYLADKAGLIAGRDFAQESVSRMGLGGMGQKLTRNDFSRAAYKTLISDNIKNSTAFELGVYSTMNGSDVLYPDDFDSVDFAMLSGLGIALPAGAEYFITRAALKQSMRVSMRNGLSPEMQELRNSVGDAALSAMWRGPTEQFPGEAVRGDLAGMFMTMVQKEELLRDQAGDSLLKTNLNDEIIQLRKTLTSQIEKMMTDKMPGLSSSKSFESPEVAKTVMQGLENDPLLLVGLNTLEKLPHTKEGLLELTDTLKASHQKLDDMISGLPPDGGGYDIAALSRKRAALDPFANSFWVLGADGAVTLAKDYTPRYADVAGQGQMKAFRSGAEETSIYYDLVPDKPGNHEFVKVGFSLDGNWYLPQPGSKVIIQQSETMLPPGYTRVVDPLKRAEEPHQPMMNWLADNYQISPNRIGLLAEKEILPKLSQKAESAVMDFVRGIAMGNDRGLKKHILDMDDVGQEIYNAYADVRKRMHQIRSEAGGTIGMYRGESRTALMNPKSDIASFSSDPRQAAKFGEQVVHRLNPIEDLVAIIGGLNEREFLFKGNKNRVLSSDPKMGVKTVSEKIVGEENAAYSAQSFYRKSAGFVAMQKAIENFPKSNKVLYLSDNDHWTRLEYAAELMKRYGSDVQDRIQLPSAWRGDSTAIEFAILHGKFNEFRALMKNNEELVKAGAAFSSKAAISPDDMRYLLNLPSDQFGNVHPLLAKFQDMYSLDITDLKKSYRSLTDFYREVQETAALPDIVSYRADRPIELRGGNLTTKDGKSVVMFRKNVNPSDDYSVERMKQRAADRRTLVINKMIAPDAPAIVRQVSESILRSVQDFNMSTKVDQLVEGSQTSKGVVTTRALAGWDDPVLGSTNRIMAMRDRALEEVVGKLFEPHLAKFNKLRQSDNKGALESFNLARQSMAYRWYLDPQSVDLGEGMFTLKMVNNDTAQGKFNRDLYFKMFGKELSRDEVAYLPTMVKGDRFGQTLGMPLDTLDAINSISQLTSQSLENTNYLRRLIGMSQIPRRDWYIPPPRLRGREVAYILREGAVGGKVVVVGRNQSELQSKIAKVREKGDVVVSQESMENFFDLEDEAFGGLLDYSDTILQTGKRSTGGLGNPITEIGPAPLNDIIETINDQFHQTGKRASALIYEPQLNYTKMAASTTGAAPGEASIHNTYAQMIWGGQSLSRRTDVGQVYGAIEGVYDRNMQRLWNRVMKVRGTDPKGNAALYRELDKQLGEYNPFSSTSDFIEKTFKVAPPVSMKQHMAKLNEFTSTLTLRMFETGHAVLNLVSLAATMPAVIRALNRRQGEELIDWQNRIGSFGTMVGDNIPTFTPAKAITSTIHEAFNNPEFREVWMKAAKRGWLEQDVAEMMRTITAPKEGYSAGIVRKMVDYTSILSDRSEKLARGLAFMTGYNTFKKSGMFIDEENIMAAAYDFANKVIGDYRPSNRPQIFQGAVGMPLGLFQTFTWNYMQRMFGYVQNKQWGALATGYGMQAAIFGAESVPGFTQFNDYFATSYDGSVDPASAIANRFGQPFADMFLYGSLSNIPKIFGGDGFALYTRGTIDPKIATVFNPSNSPVVNMLDSTWQMASKSIGQFLHGGQFSPQRQMEIVGTYFINRPIANLMDIASGYAVDRRGQVVEDDTRSGLSIAARAVGSRPLEAARQDAAYRRVRSGELSRTAIRSNLNENFRALVRDGNLTESEVSKALRDYYISGGSAEGFVQWLRTSMMTAQVSKFDLKLKELMGSERVQDALRLINSRQLYEGDPEFESQ